MSKLSKVISLFLAVSLLLSIAVSGTAANAATGSSAGTTYYISSSRGNDANDGRSPATAWKTIDRINATTFQPGDTILFKARDEWHGQIWFKGQGTAEHPIKVDMYGDVAAGDEVNYPAIHGDGVERKQGSTGTIMLVNTPYWEVRHLQITNDDNYQVDNYDNVYDPVTRLCTNLRDGIMVLLNSDELPAGSDDFVFNHIYIEDNYIHDVDSVGYWTNGRGNFSPDLGYNNALFSGGIMVFIVGSAKPNMTYDGVRIANNTLEKVDFLGIGTFDFSDHDYMQKNTVTLNHMMKNVYIGHNYLHDIGQGVIDACNLEGGVVEYNVGDDWGNRYAAECAGIYPWRSNNTVLSHNIVSNGPESFPKTTGDGTAWDIDSGLYNITYEHNYSYKNPMGTVSFLGRNYNTIYRYNIADRDQSYFIKWGWFGRDYTDLYFMNNLAYFDSTSLSTPGTSENASRAYRFTGASTSISSYFTAVNVYFINNLFYDYGNGDPAQGTNNFSHYFFQGRTSSANNNYGTAIFQNNYFYEANRPGVYPAGIYAPWQVNTAVNTGNYYHGMAGAGIPLAEPGLVGLSPTFSGEPPLDKPMNLSDPYWANFKLRADSPLIDAGKFVRQIGPVDFYGNQLYYGAAPDIGVHEYTEGLTRTVPDYSEAPRSNLAYGKTITTQYADQISYTLNDGNLENAEDSIHYNWHTPNTDPQYIEIDFGEPTTFNNVRLYEWITNPPAWTATSTYMAKRPHLQYYNYEYWDGEKWVVFYDATPDVDRAAGGTVPTTYLSDTFAPVTASKIRINLLKMDDLVVLREVEVYNQGGSPSPSAPVQPDLALGAASSPNAAGMFDGNDGTSYTGLEGDQSISITLPSGSKFNRISIKEPTNAITSYSLKANVDGEWVTLASGSGIGRVNTNLFDAVEARDLRLDYTASSAPDIASFGVYLVRSLTPEADTPMNLVAGYNFENVSGSQVMNTTGGAIAVAYGVDFVEDPERGRVAYFGNQGLTNTDYLRVTSADTDFSTSNSISMWIKPDPAFMYGWVATNSAVQETLFSKGVNGSESYSATIFANGLTGAFQNPLGLQRDGGTARGPRWVPVSAGSLDDDYYVQTGQWNHVVFTWDGYYYSAYVNGLRVLHTRVKDPYNDAPKPFFAVPTEPLYFGNQKPSATTAATKNPYFGYMDDIRIYSNVLSSNQVRDLYEQASAPRELTGININTSRVRTVYDVGESLDLTGLTVKAAYSDGSTKTITSYTTDPAKGATLSEEGSKTVTVTYTEGGATYTASFQITVVASLTLEIASLPTTVNYVVGDRLDLSGLVVRANYKAGYSDILTASQYATSLEDGSVLDEAGVRNITVSYTRSGIVQTISFIVMVWENEIPATTTGAIMLARLPDKTAYLADETLDMGGSVVMAVYSDNTSEIITDYTVTPALDTPLTVDDTLVTLGYDMEGETKTVRFPITVHKIVHVSYRADDRTSGDVPVDAADYLNGQSVTVMGRGDLARSGYTFDGWAMSGVRSAVYNEGDTFEIGSSDVILKATWRRISGGSTGGGSTGGGSSAPSQSQPAISINGAGTVNPDTIDTSASTYTLNAPVINNTVGLTIPVSILNNLTDKNKSFILTIVSDIGSYSVPVNLPGMIPGLDAILAEKGVKAEDVSIKITITDKTNDAGVQAIIADNLANGRIVGNPVDFSMTLVNSSSGAVIQEIGSFTDYIVRSIPISDGVEPSAQLSAFRINRTTGELEFVPHLLVMEDGKLVMEIKSKTNSVYLVAENNVKFDDVASGYWGAQYIGKAASKGLVQGMGNNRYDPERSVTRAQFVRMIVNSLDLPEAAAGTETYSDVDKPAQWYYDAIMRARSAGLLNHFKEQAFKPDQAITREEMASIMAAVLKSEKIITTLEAIDLNQKFADYDRMDTTLLSSIELVYKLDIMTGVSSTSYDPKGIATRAQSAKVLLRLLEVLGLINK